MEEDLWRALAGRIASAPVAWLPAAVLAPAEDLDAAEAAGWLARWHREEGWYETLTPWAAAELGVHLVEATGAGLDAALAYSTPEEGEAVCRWAPLAEEGPAPVQPRERPCVRRVTAWDLMAERRVPAEEAGGRGKAPERGKELRRLLLQAERESREREREAARRRLRHRRRA